MYAIVEIAGLQYKVEKDQQLYVNRLSGNKGDALSFDKVLLTDNGSIAVGAPVIEGALVEAKILEHLRGDKVIVFKKKRRKGYQKKNGFRAALTKIEITGITGGSGKSDKKSDKKSESTSDAQAKAKVADKKVKKVDETETTSAMVASAEKNIDDKKSQKVETNTEKTVAPIAEKKAEVKSDDLTVIEGIGPKTAEFFNENGINSFSDLAAKKSTELSEMLSEKGGTYAGMDTETWPKQAKMAAEGKMDELKAWQNELDGGAEVKADDLTLVEGIGPKVQEILNENGVKTFKKLASISSDDIKNWLESKGGVYAGMDSTTWPEQAKMAAEGKMDELKKWQDELNAGK